MRNLLILVILLVVLGGGYYWYTSQQSDSMMENDSMMEEDVLTDDSMSDDSMMKKDDAMMEDGTMMDKGDAMMGTVKEFTVSGQPFSFSPNTMTVKKGDTVRITFKNVQGTHDLVIDEFNARTKVIQTGQEETIEFVADKAGTFEYYCSVGNHRALGMVGTLTVSE